MRTAWLGFGSLLVGACSSYSSSDPPTAMPDAGAAEPIDGGAANLIPNGDFELGCTGWIGEHTKLTDSTDPHSGAKSCQVCSDSDDETDAYTQFNTQPKVGAVFAGDFWVKAPAMGNAPPTATIEMGLDTADGHGSDDGPSSPLPNPSSTWGHGSMSLTISKANGVDVWLAVVIPRGNRGKCLVIDDAALHSSP